MQNPLLFIRELFEEAKKLQAFKVEALDKAAYNHEAFMLCWERYIPTEVKRTTKAALQELPDPFTRMGAVSEANLGYIYRHTYETVHEAVSLHGQSAVNTLIETLREICTISNIALTHTPFFKDSTFSKGESSLTAILKDKELKAPRYYLKDRNDFNTLISCAAEDKQDPIDLRGTYFRIDQIPNNLIPRSMGSIFFNKEDGVISDAIAVGGQHFQTAWLLAAIHNMLVRAKCLGRELSKMDDARLVAFLAFDELKVPRKLALTGHSLVRDGQIEEIKPLLASSKPRAVQKRDLTPERANHDLRNAAHTISK